MFIFLNRDDLLELLFGLFDFGIGKEIFLLDVKFFMLSNLNLKVCYICGCEYGFKFLKIYEF